MAELSVKLVAELKQFLKDVETAKGSLKDFGKQAGDLGGKLESAEGNLDDLAEGFLLTAIGATTLVGALAIVVPELYRVATASNAAELSQLALAGAMGKATASTAAEIITLDTLVELAQDETLSRERRNRAVKELHRIYPKVLKNLTAENINTAAIKDTLDLLSSSIVRNSQIKAIAGEITRQQTIIWKEENKTLWERVDVWDALTRVLAFNWFGGFVDNRGPLDSITREGENAAAVIVNLTEELIALLRIENRDGVQDAPKDPKNRKSLFPLLDVPTIPPGTFDITDSALEGLENVLPTYRKAMKNLAKVNEDGVKTTKAFASNMEEIFFDLNESLKATFAGGLVNTISNLGDDIGQALANGGNIIQTIGASLIRSLGAFLGEIGKLLIEYGTLAVAKGSLDVAISTLFGPAVIGAGLAAIGVGIALSAAGGAFKNIGNKGLRQSSVGSTSSGSNFSGSTSTGGVQTFGDGTVVFEIAGTKLVGVLSRTLAQNKRLGGTLNLGG